MLNVRLLSSRGLLLRGLRVWGVLLLLCLIGLWQVRAVAEEEFSNVPELSEPVRNQLLALRMFQDEQGEREWDWEDWEALLELWQRESSWRAGAANPKSTARGIPQAMMSLNPDIATNEWLSNPKAQIEWGMDYISKRYGSPREALEFHDREGWY